MHTRLLANIALLSAAAAALAGAPLLPAQQPLKLPDAIARALAHNPELALDEPELAAARADERAAQAARLPELGAQLNYGGGNNPVYVFGTRLSQRRFTQADFALPALNRPDALQNVQTRLSAQQTLWDFGRTAGHMRAARLGVALSEHGAEDHRRRVILETVEAYYGVALARAGLEAARAALQSAESIAEQARARVESGFAVEADRLRALAHLAEAHRHEIEARGMLASARATLNRILGLALDADPGEPTALSPARLPIPAEETLLAEQVRRRPDYRRLATEVRQAEEQLRSRKADLYPVLSGFAAWETDNPSWVTAGGSNWLAGFSLQWNISAGGAEHARLEAARQRLEQKRRQAAAMESAMRLELHQALIQVRSAEQMVEAARAAERQSEESLQILRNRYDAGLATMTDLLAAEAARAQARSALAEAVYRHRVSYAHLEAAAGILSPTSLSTNP